MNNLQDDYQNLITQIKVIKDRIRGVIHKKSNGVYLYGRPGTSKSYTVCTTLKHLGVNYKYSNGHLTPIGLFDLISENRDRVIVLDDVASIFNQPIALQILLAALGNSHEDTGVRYVRYKTAKGDRVVDFTGGIIGISNLPLERHNNEVIRALNDRVFTVQHDPSDEQIIALMKQIASEGVNGVPGLECQTVCNFLINELQTREIRPTIRMFVDKAIKDYELWKMNGSETHWKDLVVSNLEQQLIDLKHPINDISMAEKIEADRRVAVDVYLSIENLEERIKEWNLRTGKSQSAFYRRLKEAKKRGLLL